jgi:L-histidine N-alpha-methyltransferase
MTVVVDVHLTPHELHEALKRDVRHGMRRTPKELPPKYFLDERGAQLLELLRETPEHYQQTCERALLLEHAAAIATTTAADTLVEIGSTTSERTRVLLDALSAAGTLRTFVPFDVEESCLRTAAEAVAAAYPGLLVHAVVGDLEQHVELLPRGGTRLVVMLGGTIGNLRFGERATLLDDVRAGMHTGDALLLGVDLAGDTERLVAAYDDAAGLTAELNRNLLHVINRELAGRIDPEGFSHIALWSGKEERIELWLEALEPQRWELPSVEIDVLFAAGERVRTSTSAKFTRPRIAEELRAADLTLTEWWTDDADRFALALATPAR